MAALPDTVRCKTNNAQQNPDAHPSDTKFAELTRELRFSFDTSKYPFRQLIADQLGYQLTAYSAYILSYISNTTTL
jgi:hypothetical protein